MTVASTQNRKTYAGNGSTTSFATSPVVFFDTDDLTVYVTTDATGAATLLTENTHYTVSGGSGSTGTVDTSTGSSPYGAPASGVTLVIVRELDLVQEVDFVNNEATDAEVTEDSLDKLTMMAQQLDQRIDRAVVLADSDVSGIDPTLPTPVADGILKVNGAGDGFEFSLAADIDLAVVSPFIETLLDDTTATAALATLGVSLPLPASSGGTGVANNVAATLTRSGNHALTLTTSGTTNVTLPTSGTLATLAGAEVFTNKTVAFSANAIDMSDATASLSADVALNNTGSYFDGPSLDVGNTGKFFVSGNVTFWDTAGVANFEIKLWDGTTVISSAYYTTSGTNHVGTVSLSGKISTPAGNLRISVKDLTSTSGEIKYNLTGNSKDSTITAIRVG